MTTARSDGDRLETLLSARRKSSSLPFEPEPDPEPEPFDDLPDLLCPDCVFVLVTAFNESLRGRQTFSWDPLTAGFEKLVTKFRTPHVFSDASAVLSFFSIFFLHLFAPSSSSLTTLLPIRLSLSSCILLFSARLARSSSGVLDEGGVVGEKTSSPMGDENGRRGRIGGLSWSFVGVAFSGFGSVLMF